MSYGKTFTYKHICFIAITGALQSCNTMYIPAAQNVPMFKEKQEAQISIAKENYQLALSPINNFGLIINGQNRNAGGSTWQYGDKSCCYKNKVKNIEAGVGYFKSFKYVSFEIFGGGGQGYSRMDYLISASVPGGGVSHFKQYFLQPDISVGIVGFRFALSVKHSWLNFYDFNSVNRPGLQLTHKKIYFFQPAVTCSYRYKWIGVKSQIQISTTDSKDNIDYGYYTPYGTTVRLSLAVNFHVDEFFKKKDGKKINHTNSSL